MGKVKMQIDFTKSRPRHVWIGLHPEDDIIGIWKPLQYKNVSPYCEYCRHKGHDIDEFKSKMIDEEYRQKKKEKEGEKKKESNKENNRKIDKAKEWKV